MSCLIANTNVFFRTFQFHSPPLVLVRHLSTSSLFHAVSSVVDFLRVFLPVTQARITREYIRVLVFFIMDLLRLGAQARKTGWRPRANVAKDKYNMDDIDDFFNDTEMRDEKPRKTLGVRRRVHLPRPEAETKEAPKEEKRRQGEKTRQEEKSRAHEKNQMLEHDVPHTTSRRRALVEKTRVPKHQASPGREAYAFEILDDELHDSMTLSPIPLLSLQKAQNAVSQEDLDGGTHFDETDRFDEIDPAQFDEPDPVNDPELGQTELAAPELALSETSEPLVESPSDDDTRFGDTGLEHVRTPSKPVSITSRKRRPRVADSDSEPEPEVYSDGADEFDSDFHEPSQSQHSTQGYSTQGYSTQGSQSQNLGYSSQKLREVIMQPSPLPSPPPEGLRRSKRTKIAPLAYWRNERIVYSRANDAAGDPDSTLISDIRKVPLQQIYEVVHIPEPLKQKHPARRGRPPKNDKGTLRGRKPKPKPEGYDYESDPEIEGSEWFKQKSLEAEVFLTEDSRAERVVAWTPDGGDFQLPPPPSKGLQVVENFKVAPLFDADSDMIAAGLLEFPVEGFKSLRTAGDSLFIFHVAKGMVEVTLNTDKFVVTRGCSFEVPKLNIYSLKNIGQTTARLFFVQCQLGEKAET